MRPPEGQRSAPRRGASRASAERTVDKGERVLAPGEKVGGYEIVAPLRAGGMATLYLARRAGAAGFERFVALKVVHSHLVADPTFARMFVAEAKLCARIQHPRVVHVEELGEHRGMHFLAMEYVHGVPLSTVLGALAPREAHMPIPIAVSIAVAIAEGLHAAHETRGDDGAPLGVVHRDVSPQNVLVSEDGHVLLIDFGIAKVGGIETTTGSLKGKLAYMSPEQSLGQRVDRRTDVFALAVVLWEMLTVERLFGGANEAVVLDRVRSAEVEPPSVHRAEISPALDRAIMEALARDPEQRTPTAQALRSALLAACPEAAPLDASEIAAFVRELVGPLPDPRHARRELSDARFEPTVPRTPTPAMRVAEEATPARTPGPAEIVVPPRSAPRALGVLLALGAALGLGGLAWLVAPEPEAEVAAPQATAPVVTAPVATAPVATALAPQPVIAEPVATAPVSPVIAIDAGVDAGVVERRAEPRARRRPTVEPPPPAEPRVGAPFVDHPEF